MKEKEIVCESALLLPLEELQSGKRYQYCLTETEAGRYCVSVSAWQDGEMRQNFSKDFVADGTKANNVVQLLYQNAVAPVHLQDVLHDLKAQGYLAMRE